FNLLAQSFEPCPHFIRLQNGYRLVECARLQIEKQRNRHSLKVPDSVRRFHRRTGKSAGAPWLASQSLGKDLRKIFKLVDIVWLTQQCESQLARLFEIAIVNFQGLDRLEIGRKHVDHIRVDLDSRNEDPETSRSEKQNAAPDQGPPSRYRSSDEITHS